VHVVDGLPDDKGDLKQPAGNQVVIQIAEGRYVLLAHMKNGSVAVKEGDEVAIGDRVGALGNSGNSSMPHLHLQVQSHPELSDEGLETFPIRFASSPGDGRVRRGDVLSPSPQGEPH
jgi:murein DD-endopeptidase MepM/ murein hydrolase activator NlpD